jgi:hypothetical protein
MGSETERCSSFSADSYNDGLSSTSVNEVNDETNSSSQKGQNKVSQSSGSSKSSDSRIIQSSTEFTNSNSEGSYGLSNRVDRTKALGNSIVPAVAAIPLQRVHDLYYK